MELILTIVGTVVAGFCGGLVNTMAGGGSMITVPSLILLGLDANSANATNRLAVVVQSLGAMAGFKQKKVSDFPISLKLAAATIPGAVIGAFVASNISSQLFERIFGVMMLVVLALMLQKKTVQTAIVMGKDALPHLLWTMVIFFGIGLYGGFLQMGTGLLIISGLRFLTPMGLVQINAHKVVVVAVYTFFAAVVFLTHGLVVWKVSIALIVGMGLGGYVGSHFAVIGGERALKWVLAVVVVVFSARLLGVFTLIQSLVSIS